MHSKKAAAAFIFIGCILLSAAIALGGYNLWDDHRAAKSVNDILDNLSFKNPAEPDYILNPYMDMPTQEINGYLYIGKLSIPSLELELPVMDRWDYTRMRISPCRYTGTAYLPGFVLCAHNYASHFGRLKNLSPGDDIFFTDVSGNEFSYKVAKLETLSPTQVEQMKTSDWDLTLFSCNISGRARVTVRCEKREKAE